MNTKILPSLFDVIELAPILVFGYRGFVDVESSEPSAIKRGSLYLLGGTLVALGLSIAFHGQYA